MRGYFMFFGVTARIGWALALLMVCGPGAWAGELGDKLVGRWLTEGGESIIEISKKVETVGESGAKKKTHYYGKLVWIHDKVYEERGMKVTDTLEDWNNPDESRRKDPLLGSVILKAFVYNSQKSRWDKGHAYDPESGKHYKATLRLTKADDGDDRLFVRGYVGISLIGRTVEWTRAKDEQ